MALKFLRLPLYNDTYYSYSVPLEGNSYVLKFLFIERLQDWVLTLSDSDGNVLVRNQRLTSQTVLFADYKLPNLSGGFYLEPLSTTSYVEGQKEKLKDFYRLYYIYDEGE